MERSRFFRQVPPLTEADALTGQTMYQAIDGTFFARLLTCQKVSGQDRVQRTLKRLSFFYRQQALPLAVDQMAYAIAWSLETARLGMEPTRWLWSLTVKELCFLVAELVQSGKTQADVPSWLNSLSFQEKAGKLKRVK